MEPSRNERKPATLFQPSLLLATDRRKARQIVRDHGLSQQWACALVTWVLRTEPPGSLPLRTEGYKEVRGLTISCTRGKFSGQSGGRACEGGTVCDFDQLSPFQTRAGSQEERPGWRELVHFWK